MVVSANTPRNFISASIVKSSELNGATNTYTFSIVPASPLINGDLISITVPDTVTAPLSPVCTGITSLNVNISCFTLNKVTQLTISTNLSKILELSEVKFSVSGY